MLERQDDTARWDELFAVVKSRLDDDDRRLTAPTAVLRLKRAIDAAANASICRSALQDLRAAMGGEVAARRDLTVRCNRLEDALRDLHRESHDRAPRAAIPAPLEPSSREWP